MRLPWLIKADPIDFWLEGPDGLEIPYSRITVKARRSGRTVFDFRWTYKLVYMPKGAITCARIYVERLMWQPKSMPIAMPVDDFNPAWVTPCDSLIVYPPMMLTVRDKDRKLWADGRKV